MDLLSLHLASHNFLRILLVITFEDDTALNACWRDERMLLEFQIGLVSRFLIADVVLHLLRQFKRLLNSIVEVFLGTLLCRTLLV